MKKLFKIAGIALLSLIGLLLAIFLLARFVFREQAIDYLTGLENSSAWSCSAPQALTPPTPCSIASPINRTPPAPVKSANTSGSTPS